MKTAITNRHGLKVVVLVDEVRAGKGLAFVMHGLGGFKEQKHIEQMAETLNRHNYTTVRFDTTNSFGESDGQYEDATVTNYKEDLEDVIAWATTQSWYQEPFILAGHSLGGFCPLLYAEEHPDKVLAIAPIATVVSGQLSLDYKKATDPKSISEWEKTGWQILPSHSKPGAYKKLKWSHMVDRIKYDILPRVGSLTMPVLLVVGSDDTATPPEHQRLLFDTLPGEKEFHVIKGMKHTPHEEAHLKALDRYLDNWLSGQPWREANH